VVGQEYWAYIVRINSKGSGLIRHVKPFKLKLIKSDNSYYKNTGSPHIWSFSCLDWDFSNCKKKMRQPDAELFYDGFVCDTEEECIESYNKFMDDTAKDIKKRLSHKYNNEYIKGITDGILKNKIK
jgi:hypothetical protein